MSCSVYCTAKKKNLTQEKITWKVLRYLQVAPNPLLDQQSYPTQLMRKSSTLTSEFKLYVGHLNPGREYYYEATCMFTR